MIPPSVIQAMREERKRYSVAAIVTRSKTNHFLVLGDGFTSKGQAECTNFIEAKAFQAGLRALAETIVWHDATVGEALLALAGDGE